MNTCHVCQQPGAIKAHRGPILPGVPARACVVPDLERHPAIWFHPDCYRGWYADIYSEYVDLDMPLNDCAYFVRCKSAGLPADEPWQNPSEYGWYERDGKRSPMTLWQAKNDYDIWTIPEFSQWYDAQGWSRESWFDRFMQTPISYRVPVGALWLHHTSDVIAADTSTSSSEKRFGLTMPKVRASAPLPLPPLR